MKISQRTQLSTTIIAIIAILILSFSLRAYTVSLNLPFFYDEDEAHHFNRTVNMVKEKSLNPNYFHKPSLHFYLRMPIVVMSYWWNKNQGHLSSLNKIRTHDKFGIAEYAFTASHPGIVKWNRAFSLILSLLIIIFTYLIAKELCDSTLVALGASLGAAVSPPLISYSGIIGVDVPMTLMVLISVFLSMRFAKTGANKYFLAATIFAGLAVSSKYNAAPIVVAPLIACYFSGKLNKRSFLYCVFIPILSFLAASPYILVSIHLFIQQVGYEVWHYAVAGHEGNSATPGLGQIKFYAQWFYSEAVGPVILVLAILGFILLVLQKNKTVWVFMAFPVLFFTLMIAQKANFTRNMLVLIPFLSIASAYSIVTFVRYVNFNKINSLYIIWLLFIIAATPPLVWAMRERQESLAVTDSRNDLSKWFKETNDLSKEIALSGQLQVSRDVYKEKNVSVIDETRSSPIDLYLNGYDRIIVGDEINPSFHSLPILKNVQKFEGIKGAQRIVKNPSILIFDFIDNQELLKGAEEKQNTCQACNITFSKSSNGEYLCNASAAGNQEAYCWTSKRISFFNLIDLEKSFSDKNEITLKIEAMTPWENNTFAILLSDGNRIEFKDATAGEWNNYSLKIKKEDLHSENSIEFYSKFIASPFRKGISDDKRRLGWAIRNITVTN